MVYRKQVILLKGHGHMAMGFLQKLVPHESLTLPFKPFRFWLRIRGDISIRKRLRAVTDTGVAIKEKKRILQAILSTPRLTDAGSQFSNTNISENVMPKSKRLEM
jgi:hypothetical protein